MEGTDNVPPDSTNDGFSNIMIKAPDKNSNSDSQSNNSLPTSTVTKPHNFYGAYLPDDDGNILTPEHAFVQYQTRSEDQACQICGQPAVGFHHRAYVCEACKKFFMRHTAARLRNSELGSAITESICPMGGRCRVEGPGRGKCPHCRYRKCLDLGMTLTPPGGEAGCDISQIPCRVCGGPSSGFHFGALTCEGCKGFFRRTVLSNVRLECLGNNDCPITPANRNMCKSCRFQRCLAVGMSKAGSRIGRQPNAIKYYCAREISQLSTTGDSDGNTSPSIQSSVGAQTTHISCSRGMTPHRSNSVASNNRLDDLDQHPRATSLGSSWPPARNFANGGDLQSCSVENGNLIMKPSSASSTPTPLHHYGDKFGLHDKLEVDLRSPGIRLSGCPTLGDAPDSVKNFAKRRKTLSDKMDYPPPTHSRSLSNESDCMPHSSHSDQGNGQLDNGCLNTELYRISEQSRLAVDRGTRLSKDCYMGSVMDHGFTSRDPARDRTQKSNSTYSDYSNLAEMHSSLACSGSFLRQHHQQHDNSAATTPSSSTAATATYGELVHTNKFLSPLALHLPFDSNLDESMGHFGDSNHHMRLDSHSSSSDGSQTPHNHSVHAYRDQSSSTILRNLHAQNQIDLSNNNHAPSTPNNHHNNHNNRLSELSHHAHHPPVDDCGLESRKFDFTGKNTNASHLTTAVMQFRQQQHQQQQLSTISSSDRTVTSPLTNSSSTNDMLVNVHRSQPYMKPGQVCSSTAASCQEDQYSLSYQTSTPPTRPTISTNQNEFTQPALREPEAPSWNAKQRYLKNGNRSLSNDHLFRSPSNVRYDPNSPGFSSNSNNSSGGAETSPSSSIQGTEPSWFAAAAAAAAMANALMVASQSQSPIPVLDSYTVSSSSNSDRFSSLKYEQTELVGSRSGMLVSNNMSKNLTTSVPNDVLAVNSNRTPKCDPDTIRSLYSAAVSYASDSGAPVSLTHTSAMNAMRAAAAAAAATAAAAVAATAAGLVLTNGRVRGLPDDFSTLTRPAVLGALSDVPSYSSSTSSPSPPVGGFNRIGDSLSMYSDRIPHSTITTSTTRMDYAASIGIPMLGDLNTLPIVSHSSKEVISRTKNGIRVASLTTKEFTDGIQVAVKYMLSERKKIRVNLPQPFKKMHRDDPIEEIWDRMMQHFELHSRFIVNFVKYIPGFNSLELGDRRQLVRGAMYPLMLLELSRDYEARDTSEYNYFDFTIAERDVILSHFPTFHAIAAHLIHSGEVLNSLHLDDLELTLVCALEVFKNRQPLNDPAGPNHLYHLAERALAEYVISAGHTLDDRHTALLNLSPLLEKLNMEHHEVIAQLRHDKPYLDFPDLYMEMFQLTEEECQEQSVCGLQATESSS